MVSNQPFAVDPTGKGCVLRRVSNPGLGLNPVPPVIGLGQKGKNKFIGPNNHTSFVSATVAQVMGSQYLTAKEKALGGVEEGNKSRAVNTHGPLQPIHPILPIQLVSTGNQYGGGNRGLYPPYGRGILLKIVY